MMLSKEEMWGALLNPRNALILCLLLYLIIPLRTFTNSPFPGGVDSATHLFQIGLISQEGFTPWDHWWYGGVPLLEQYPPLSHWVASLFVGVLGVETAYKLVFTLAFLAIPLAFFLLIQEFGLDERQKAFALYVLSLSPVFSYDLQGGVFSSIFALPFAFLFFKYAIKALGEKDWLRPAVLSAIFLAIAALSHLFMPLAAIAFAFIYLLAFRPSFESMKRFAGICLLAGFLVAFFWAPLALDYKVGSVSTSDSLASMVSTALAPFGRAFAVYINLVSVLAVAALGALTLLSVWRQYESRDLRLLLFFAASIALIMAWVAFLPYGDAGGSKLPLFIPMIFALFFAGSFGKWKAFDCLAAILLLLMLVSVLLVEPSYVPPKVYDMAKWAASETQGRMLMIPQGLALTNGPEDSANPAAFLYDTYLVPHYFGKEVYDGWFPEIQPRNDTGKTGFTCTAKRSASELVSGFGVFSRMILGKQQNCTIGATPKEFCDVIRTGGVDTVIASSDFPEVISFADSAPCLSKIKTNNSLVAYRVEGAVPYLAPAFNYTKESGTIKIDFNGPYEGEVSVLENYYPAWKATLDSSELLVLKGPDGFLRILLNADAGKHQLSLAYVPNGYYGVFIALSALSWLGAVLFIAFGKPKARFF